MAGGEVAAAGVSIGGVGLLFNILTAIPRLNAMRHSAKEFDERLQILGDKVDGCMAKHTQWTRQWKYGEDERFEEYVYEELWGDEYERIRGLWQGIIDANGRLAQHIERVRNRPAARRKIAFALASEESLGKELSELEDRYKALEEASKRQLEKLEYPPGGPQPSAATMARLQNLHHFGARLDPRLSNLPLASNWSLELCHPDMGCDAQEWERLPFFQVRLSYTDQGPGQHHRRIELKYSPHRRHSPANWTIDAPDHIADAPPAAGGEARNPEVSRIPHIVKKTRPFGDLLMAGVFRAKLTPTLWEGHKAHLVLSLVNWSILLWTSDRTATWCCSGLQFVQLEADADLVGDKEYFFPSFSRCARQQQQQGEQEQQQQPLQEQHEQPPQEQQQQEQEQQQEQRRRRRGRQQRHQGQPEQQQRQGQQRQPQHQHPGDAIHPYECGHVGQRLAELGLVLAQIICATPFRASRSPAQYHKWDATRKEWRGGVTREKLLDMVEEESSEKVRAAVRLCLAPPDWSDGSFLMYKDYIERILNPCVLLQPLPQAQATDESLALRPGARCWRTTHVKMPKSSRSVGIRGSIGRPTPSTKRNLVAEVISDRRADPRTNHVRLRGRGCYVGCSPVCALDLELFLVLRAIGF